MTLYLYALADRLDEVGGLHGIQDEALHLLNIEGLTIVAGDIETAPLITREMLVAQDQLVRQLHDRASALLPMRFGSVFRDQAEVAASLSARSAALKSQLGLVRDRDQMTIHVFGSRTIESPQPPPRSGREYLERRAASATPRELAPLLDALKPLVRATKVETGRQEGMIATVYQLVDRGTAGAYTSTANSVAAMHLRISGPSPAYAFTSVFPAAPDRD